MICASAVLAASRISSGVTGDAALAGARVGRQDAVGVGDHCQLLRLVGRHEAVDADDAVDTVGSFFSSRGKLSAAVCASGARMSIV